MNGGCAAVSKRDAAMSKLLGSTGSVQQQSTASGGGTAVTVDHYVHGHLTVGQWN